MILIMIRNDQRNSNAFEDDNTTQKLENAALAILFLSPFDPFLCISFLHFYLK